MQPLLSRADRPIDWAAAKMMLWMVMPRDSTSGYTSTVLMKKRPDGLGKVSTEVVSISDCQTNASDDLLIALLLYA